jgi:hypothetical protein
MKKDFVLFVLANILLLVFTVHVVAQSDSIGKKHYAYAQVYSDDTYTEYVSSVFCWTNNSPKSVQPSVSDSLTNWAKAIFKNSLPDIKIRGCTCKFEIDSARYYNADEALKNWNQKIDECHVQSISVVIVTFPNCMEK